MKVEQKTYVSAGKGIGLCGAIFIVFLTLKLMGVIHWAWVWILSPLWIPAALTLTAIAVIAGMFYWVIKRG